MEELSAVNRPTLQYKSSVFRLVNWLIRLDAVNGTQCDNFIQQVVSQRTHYHDIRQEVILNFEIPSEEKKFSSANPNMNNVKVHPSSTSTGLSGLSGHDSHSLSPDLFPDLLGDSADPNHTSPSLFNDPSSSTESSSSPHAHGYRRNASYWNTFVNVEPMPDLRTLQKDIERTHSDRAFFQSPNTHRLMERIFFIWMYECKQFASYQQGMNELLGIILLALRRDIWTARTKPLEEQDEYLKTNLIDPAYLEHDAYLLFRSLMTLCLPFFTAAALPAQSKNNKNNFPASSPGSLSGSSEQSSQTSSANGDVKNHEKEQEEENKGPPLYRKIQHIHHNMLKHIDPALHSHLERHDVVSTTYEFRLTKTLICTFSLT